MQIIFETHSTSLDNEAELASGHFDVDLSPRGVAEASALGARRREDRIDTVYASDLRRAWRTAEIAFGNTGIAIVRDPRLRECDYGAFTRRPASEIAPVRERFVLQPFPGGESYTQAATRVGGWLEDVRVRRDLQRVLVVGHRVTHYALDHWLLGVPLEDSVRKRFELQPGWVYEVSHGARLRPGAARGDGS